MKLNRRLMMIATGPCADIGTRCRRQRHGIILGTHLTSRVQSPPACPCCATRCKCALTKQMSAASMAARYLVEDNASQPQQGVRAVQKLIKSDGVFAIINPFGSGPTAATVKMATDAGVVVFAPWAASAIIQKVSGNSPAFTTVQNYDTTTASGLSWAIKNWKVQKVGVIYQEGPFGDLIRAGVSTALKEAGQTVAAEAAYKGGDIDFSSQVAKLKAANVDLILSGTIIRETVGVMSEVKKLNWDVKVLTGIPGRSSAVAMLGKGAVEGLYGIGGWRLHGPDTKDDGQKFMAAYKQKFGVMQMKMLLTPTRTRRGSRRFARCRTQPDCGVAKALKPRLKDLTYSRQTFVNNHVSPNHIH